VAKAKEVSMRAIVVLLALLTLAHPARADVCAEVALRHPKLKTLVATEHPRLLKAVDAVRRKSAITSVAGVCNILPEAYLLPVAFPVPGGDTTERYALIINDYAADRFSDRALLGVVAHEFGHAAQGKKVFERKRLGLSSQELLMIDIEADAIGASWVGKRAVLKMLEELIGIEMHGLRELIRIA